jgi:hypothetical protein
MVPVRWNPTSSSTTSKIRNVKETPLEDTDPVVVADRSI